MSYIPDYRGEENEKLLNEKDKAFLLGYRAGLNDAKNVFNNLDVYEVSQEEEKVLEEFSDCMDDWCETEEIETVCSVFESADYIGDDVEIKDANRDENGHLKIYSNKE